MNLDSCQDDISVSIIMPCLNEVRSLAGCIGEAREALDEILERWGLNGEIVIADNGSSDGSQELSTRLGARVIDVAAKGYGAALIGGFAGARGEYLIMGDADGSYDFREGVAMVEALREGADLCMGSRFRGEIMPGAMPWANRHIGNPVLTGVLNVLFRTGVSDAHSGLRALTKSCLTRLSLSGPGMEFASEMVIKAALRGERIVERPVTLRPDTRGRPPHLRPWRDGWRHLRYLLMLSPLWLFAIPAVVGALAGLGILLAAWLAASGPSATSFFGNYWIVLGGAMIGVSHIAAILALGSHVYGVRAGYRRPNGWDRPLSRWVTLESMVFSGVILACIGLAVLLNVVLAWSSRNFTPTYSVLPAVTGTLLMTLGAQNVLGGFLLAIISGNEARFLTGPTA